MSRDVYTGHSGAQAAWRAMEVVANNVANVNTRGFRAGQAVFEVHGDGQGPLGTSQVALAGIQTSQGDGAAVATERPGDVALQGDGYLVVRRGGEELLTRDGALQVGPDGTLLAAGYPVQGEGGPLQVEPGASFSVRTDGMVMSQGEEIGRLRLAAADAIEPAGQSLYRATSGLRDATQTSLLPGHLEGSNARVEQLMVDLIEASRFFEACQKCMQASDEMDSRSNQSGGLK